MSAELNQAAIKKIILDWEENFPVQDWNYMGVDLWPYIRIKLYFFLLNINTLDFSSKVPEKKADENSPFRKVLKQLLQILRAFSNLYSFFDQLEQKKIIFFGAHFHRTFQGGVYFNRFFDPMIAEHQLHKAIYFIEYGKVFPNLYNQAAIVPMHQYLSRYKLLIKLKNKLFFNSGRGKIALENYNSFYKQLIRDFPATESLNLNQSDLLKWASKIIAAKGFFLKVYRKVKPEKLLFLSYYGYDDLAAAIVAGHELGIRSIDFQHGPQTNVHMAYSAWTKHPSRPYNTMPLEYWNWDVQSKNNINLWAKKINGIKAREVGHPYLSYWANFSKKEADSKQIFFSLQTLSLEEMLPIPLLELIDDSTYLWVFRKHPRSNFTSTDLIDYLNRKRIKRNRYVVQDALDSPLPMELAKSRLHITNFSGCVLEAAMLQIPSVIIHETGKELFHRYIDEELVYFIEPNDKKFTGRIKTILECDGHRVHIESKIGEITNPLLV